MKQRTKWVKLFVFWRVNKQFLIGWKLRKSKIDINAVTTKVLVNPKLYVRLKQKSPLISMFCRFKVSAPALGYPWQQMWNKANIVRFLPVNFCSNTCFFQPKSQVVTMRQKRQMEGHRNLNFEFQNLNQMIMQADPTQRQIMHSIWPRTHFCTVNSLTVFFSVQIECKCAQNIPDPNYSKYR